MTSISGPVTREKLAAWLEVHRPELALYERDSSTRGFYRRDSTPRADFRNCGATWRDVAARLGAIEVPDEPGKSGRAGTFLHGLTQQQVESLREAAQTLGFTIKRGAGAGREGSMAELIAALADAYVREPDRVPHFFGLLLNKEVL